MPNVDDLKDEQLRQVVRFLLYRMKPDICGAAIGVTAVVVSSDTEIGAA